MGYEVTQKFGLRITHWALRVCGLTSIQEFFHKDLKNTKHELESFLDQIDCNYNDKPNGNILFAATSAELLYFKDQKHKGKIVQHLLNHPHCRVIHWYANNAHGPSIIFICMIHRFPDQVQKKLWKNNVMEHAERIDSKTDPYQHRMLPKT
jgi:hypothetical protein